MLETPGMDQYLLDSNSHVSDNLCPAAQYHFGYMPSDNQQETFIFLTGAMENDDKQLDDAINRINRVSEFRDLRHKKNRQELHEMVRKLIEYFGEKNAERIESIMERLSSKARIAHFDEECPRQY